MPIVLRQYDKLMYLFFFNRLFASQLRHKRYFTPRELLIIIHQPFTADNMFGTISRLQRQYGHVDESPRSCR